MPASDLIARFLGATDLDFGIVQPSSSYHIYIRGANYLRVGELTDWSSLSLVLRFNGVGTWDLETDADSEGARLLTKQGGIIVTREIDGEETTIFSGSVSTEWTWTATGFRASGRSDDALLEEVPVRPTPSLQVGPWPDEYYVHTSHASDVLRTLISAQIANAPAPWNIPPINLGPDPGLGGTITARGRFQSVLTLMREIAATPIAGGLGFRLIQSDVEAAGLTSDIYQPQDRTADVIFSTDLGTIADYEDRWEAPPFNYVYVLGGDGFGANRTVIEQGDTTAFNETGRMVVSVVDRRDVANPSELNQTAAEELAGAASSRSVSVVPFDVPSIQYGRHYGLGDLVTVATRVGTFAAAITEIEIGLDKDRGAVIAPTVGNANLRDEAVARHIASVQDRLSNLERNWTVPPASIERGMLQAALRPPIGQIIDLAHASLDPGWRVCNGDPVSRTTFSALFAKIGTTWGAGNGSTTFNLPNLIDRFRVGAGGSHALGGTGGSASSSVVGLDHTHPGHHSHTIPDHNHPIPDHSHTIADHSHTIPDHLHTISDHSHTMATHNHLVDIDHDHPNFGVGVAGPSPLAGAFQSIFAAGASSHNHAVDVPALGPTSVGSGNQSSGGNQTNDKTGMQTNNKTSLSTNDKTGMVTADKTGASTSNKTGLLTNDDTATAPAAVFSGGSASVATLPPYAAVLTVIYTGVEE